MAETKDEKAAREEARKVFEEAASGHINPSELGRQLRHLMSDPDTFASSETGREIQEFVTVDLSDYAYSLAIHDQPAIDSLRDDIKQWAHRLGQEPEPPKPADAPARKKSSPRKKSSKK